MQDISLHINTDSSSPLPERLLNFFQPETLEGENAFWCGDCHESHRATKTLSYKHIPTILIIHLKRLILGEKIQNHIPFDTTLEMEPFMAPGLGSAQKLELIGMISYQGTEKNGHYVAVTKKGEDWILHNDATTTQITPAQLHRSQAYVLIYRKTIPSTETETKISITDTSQQPTEKLKPTYQGHNGLKKFPPHPDPPKEPYMEQQPYQEKGVMGPNLTPTFTEGSTSENPATTEILHTKHDSKALESRGKTVIEGAIEPDETDTSPTGIHRRSTPG